MKTETNRVYQQTRKVVHSIHHKISQFLRETAGLTRVCDSLPVVPYLHSARPVGHADTQTNIGLLIFEHRRRLKAEPRWAFSVLQYYVAIAAFIICCRANASILSRWQPLSHPHTPGAIKTCCNVLSHLTFSQTKWKMLLRLFYNLSLRLLYCRTINTYKKHITLDA